MRRSSAFVAVMAAMLLVPVVVTGAAQAKASGSNGQIVFTRSDRASDEDFTYTVDPDGSNMQPLSYPASRLGRRTGRRRAARSLSDRAWAFLAATSPTRR